MHWLVTTVNARTKDVRFVASGRRIPAMIRGFAGFRMNYSNNAWRGFDDEGRWDSNFVLRYRRTPNEVVGRIIRRSYDPNVRCAFRLSLAGSFVL